MQPSDGDGRRSVRVWDAPTRLFHASIIVLVPFSWWSATNDHLQWHRLSGYALLALLLFRTFWGFVGSDTARFSNFIRGPRAAIAYIRHHQASTLGHNPLGGWSVASMLLALSLQVILGLFAVDEDGLDPSPLAKYVSFETGRAIAKLHHLNFYLLLGLVATHLLAIAFYAMRRRNLVGPMITGRALVDGHPATPRFKPLWLALPGVLVAVALAWLIAHGLKV